MQRDGQEGDQQGAECVAFCHAQTSSDFFDSTITVKTADNGREVKSNRALRGLPGPGDSHSTLVLDRIKYIPLNSATRTQGEGSGLWQVPDWLTRLSAVHCPRRPLAA